MRLLSIIILFLFTTIAIGQTSWSINSYYSERGGQTKEYLGIVNKTVCCNNYGQYYVIRCDAYRETVWKEAYGYHMVKIWNSYTRSWQSSMREGYYWYYYWRTYTNC